MKLLWVEDDMVSIVHHKTAVLQMGWKITVAKTLHEAFLQLQSPPEPWDMVLIDLGIVLGSARLPQPLAALGVLDEHSTVLGRLLGLWLWEREGRRVKADGPKHAYFTTSPDTWERYSNRTPIEFSDTNGHVKDSDEYVLNKWTRDLRLPEALENLQQVWNTDFPCITGGQP